MEHNDHYSHEEIRFILNKKENQDSKGISVKALASMLTGLPEDYKLYINGEECTGVVYTSNEKGYYINLTSQ